MGQAHGTRHAESNPAKTKIKELDSISSCSPIEYKIFMISSRLRDQNHHTPLTTHPCYFPEKKVKPVSSSSGSSSGHLSLPKNAPPGTVFWIQNESTDSIDIHSSDSTRIPRRLRQSSSFPHYPCKSYCTKRVCYLVLCSSPYFAYHPSTFRNSGLCRRIHREWELDPTGD